MTTGQRIKAARKKAGLTQKQLGEKMGISFQCVAQWENDLRNPKYETLQRIADALGVAAAALIESARQAPAKLDRSRWEGCGLCKNASRISGSAFVHYGHEEVAWDGLTFSCMKYCPRCGRPLTEESWAELGRRIGGDNETADLLEPRV